MWLRVIGFASPSKDEVILESSLDNSDGQGFLLAFEELRGVNARNLAASWATQNGVPQASCTLPTSPYPVDAEGNSITMPVDPDGQLIKVHRYRINMPIVSNDL